LFHKQKRSGIHNKEFIMLKYRTMHEHNGDLAIQAQRHDPRVYSFGRILRRFSLDEIPQFWNVLMGNMSVVGPRPHLPEHNRDFAQVMGHYQVRSFVKPGITGLAQVRGFRGNASNRSALIARVVSDLHYIENWSFSLDLLIILRTMVQMIFPPKSAY
jgi:lipopolysaccharide/colanic/teichoic acid biosynthesis glycosyltransferase